MNTSLFATCFARRSDGAWLTAKFTFVARDAETGRATKIVELLPETGEEKDQFEIGRAAAERKKEVRKASKVQSAYTLEMEKMAHDMLAKAAPLSKMPALAPPNLLLMSRTELHNAFVAQPQQRNMANRIFGGFLMRRAFELAFATAYSFGGVRPKFVEVDDISFLEPVDVGDLLVFHARVLYTLPEGGEVSRRSYGTPKSSAAAISNAFDTPFGSPVAAEAGRGQPARYYRGRGVGPGSG